MRLHEWYGNQRNVQANLYRRSGVQFLGEVSQTRSNHWEHIQEDKRAGGRTTRHGRSRHRHCSSLHFLSSSPPDAGEYTVPPQVGNLDSHRSILSTTGYCWKAVEVSVQQVGVPSTKRRTSVACVRNHPSAEERLIRWKARVTDMILQPVTLGEFVGREGSYFLNRKQGEQRILLFEDSILSLTRGHILGEKTPSSGYQLHPPDVS